MSILAEALIDTFDSSTEIVWGLKSSSRAHARFSVSGSQVEVPFESTGPTDWRVGVNLDSKVSLASSLRIFSGVFQAVKEFLEVRQPERLAFASKAEAMGYLYETYLARQGTELERLGYKSQVTKMSALAEFSIVKTTPTEWNK